MLKIYSLLDSLQIINKEMGQSSSSQSPAYILPSKSKSRLSVSTFPNLKHQGILKYSMIPFSDCQQIKVVNSTQDNQEYAYIEKTRMSLQELKNSKMRIKKNFSIDQVLRIIQDLTYTLAFLEDSKTSYPLLTLNNIFFCQGKFKVLPPEMINTDIFQKTKESLKKQNKQVLPISPEIIIALRCHQCKIQEQQILCKANVFALGMIMLEICTFKDLKDCYDHENLDILNQVINSRISEIEGLYPQKIARIIANMLDYDYEERFSPKQLSIWVNRQLAQQLASQQDQNIQLNVNQVASRLIPDNQAKDVQLPNNKILVENKSQRSRMNKQKFRNKIKQQKSTSKNHIIQQTSKSPQKFSYSRKNMNYLPNPYFNKPQQNKRQELKHNLSQNKVGTSKTKYGYLERNLQENTQKQNKQLDIKYKYNYKENQGNELKNNSRYSLYSPSKSYINNINIDELKIRKNYGQQHSIKNRKYQPLRQQEINQKVSRQRQEYYRVVPQFNLNDRNYDLLENSYKNFHYPQQSQSTVRQNKNISNKYDIEPYYRHLGNLGEFGNTGTQVHQKKQSNYRESESLKFLQQELEKSKKILAQVRKTEKFEYSPSKIDF